MTDLEAENAKLRHLLGWVHARSRAGCFSRKRSERDAALADINAHTGDYANDWQSPTNPTNDGRVWHGESP